MLLENFWLSDFEITLAKKFTHWILEFQKKVTFLYGSLTVLGHYKMSLYVTFNKICMILNSHYPAIW